MPRTTDNFKPIVTDALLSGAREVIDATRRNTPFPYLIDAKLGDAEKPPIQDAETAAKNHTPLYTIGIKWKELAQDLAHNDAQHGSPLGDAAQRANAVIPVAGILNRHNRRPPHYSETTIGAFIKLGFSEPAHSPIIRAAGHVVPPPIFPLDYDLAPIIKDIAAHMARSHEAQSVGQIIQSLDHRRDLLGKWPDLDLRLLIQRVADIRPVDQDVYHPDQPWGRFISSQQLVTSTLYRILNRDQEPRHTDYLVSETLRLVGQFLPQGYNILTAVRATISKSDAISWQAPSTYGLQEWGTSVLSKNDARRRYGPGGLAYAFLMKHGPAPVEDVIEHVQHAANVKRRTIQQAINHDHLKRFIRLFDQRVAANPVSGVPEHTSPSFVVIPDQQECMPPVVLRESELLWLTRYLQELNEVPPPRPYRVTVTGPRAAGFAQKTDTLEIGVIVDSSHRANLESRLPEVADAASDAVPNVRRKVSILSKEQWTRQQSDDMSVTHHEVWRAPGAAHYCP